MRILGIVPFLFLAATVVFLRARWPAMIFREAVITAGVLTGVWLAAGTELLSVARALSFWPLLGWWVAPIGVMVWMFRKWRPASPGPWGRDWLLWGIFSGIALVLAGTFVCAFSTPPNNADALTYHLPRQVYWMQQEHVGLFPTNNRRMLAMPPLAEYAGLHLMILSGGDRWVNLIQWLAFALTALTASSIARELGGNARLQALAALLVVTIPIAVLEAVNSKNDLLAAYFLCALAFFGLRAYNSRQFSVAQAACVGIACGLLALVKGTGLMFGLPVAAWIGAACIRAIGFRRALGWGACAAVIALTINAGHFIRLTQAFGTPLGPSVSVGNTLHTPRALLSNLTRNTAMHLATGSKRIDGWTTSAVAGLHNWIRFDLNHPKTTFAATRPFAVSLDFLDEDRAKAPLHVLLAMAVFAVTMAGLFRGGDKWLNGLVLTPALGFVLFCWLLVWQEWHSRLHIPVLCLSAAFTPYGLARRWPGPIVAVAAAALMLALVCITVNPAKPLFKPQRAAARFKDPAMLAGLAEAKRACQQHRPEVVGIFTKPGSCEYFLLATLLEAQTPPPKLVRINNAFPQIQSPFGEPDMVIAWHGRPAARAAFHTNFALVATNGIVSVFLPRAK